MVSYGDKITDYKEGENAFSKCTINLVDYGFASKYLVRDSETGRKMHQQKKREEKFRGNMLFASTNQMQFYSTSRRDDVISLSYLLVYLIRDFELPGVDLKTLTLGEMQLFNGIAQAKADNTLGDLCNGKSEELCHFVNEVFKYRYADRPDYAKLDKELTKLYEAHCNEPLRRLV